jgi:hypothetical protein
MTPSRVAALVIVLMLGSIGATNAQSPGPAPGTFPTGQFPDQVPGSTPGPGGLPGANEEVFSGQAQRPGEPPCMVEFKAIRGEAEKGMAAIKAAAKRRAQPPELCQLFNKFAESEAKMVKFLEENAASCGFPTQVVVSTKSNHGKMLDTRHRICSAALGPGGEPKRPGHLHFDPVPDHVVEPGMLERREQGIDVASGRLRTNLLQ